MFNNLEIFNNVLLSQKWQRIATEAIKALHESKTQAWPF